MSGDVNSLGPIGKTGRSKELSWLVAAVKNLDNNVLESGLGCTPLKVIGIRGGIGLGKSRLVLEFLKESRAESNITVLVARSSQSSWKHDGLWDSLLRNLQTLYEAGTDQDRMDRYGPGISAGLGILLNHDEHGGSTEPAVSELESWRSSLLKILDAVAEGTSLVVVLEDVDRADSSSLETLRIALGAHYINAGILFVLTYRDLTGDMVNSISLPLQVDGMNFHEMELNPLNSDDSEKLIALLLRRAGIRSVDTGVIHLLLRLGSGSPLFLKQLVNHAVEQNLLNSHNRELSKIDEYEFLAPAMEAAALTAFSRLDRSQRDLLRIASFLDEDFCVSDIRAFGEGQFSQDDLPDRLGYLVAEGFLIVNEDSFAAKYRFTHEYMKIVARSTIPQEDLKLPNIDRKV